MGQGETPWATDELRDVMVAVVVFVEAPYGPFDYSVPAVLRGKVEPGRGKLGHFLGSGGIYDRQRRARRGNIGVQRKV